MHTETKYRAVYLPLRIKNVCTVYKIIVNWNMSKEILELYSFLCNY